jgi:hypothetical protein
LLSVPAEERWLVPVITGKAWEGRVQPGVPGRNRRTHDINPAVKQQTASGVFFAGLGTSYL